MALYQFGANVRIINEKICDVREKSGCLPLFFLAAWRGPVCLFFQQQRVCAENAVFISFFLFFGRYSCFECENIFLNLHRYKELFGMKAVRFALYVTVTLLLFVACRAAEYCNCG
jgi:hypothetical protein